jgi:cytochrome b pre-mRNA-processing protein 3
MLRPRDIEAEKDAMLGFLFRGLTAEPARGAALFETLTAEARRTSWYTKGAVPDTLDGRFAVLASVVALALARLERDGEEGNRASVALTERFIEVMESEHRELGLGDPTLGKTVRKLVAMLARRTDLWRSAYAGKLEWLTASRESLYNVDVAADALNHNAAVLKELSVRIAATTVRNLERGEIG